MQRKSSTSPSHVVDTRRLPLAIVVTDSIQESPYRAIPGLVPTNWQGVWATAELDDGGLYVLDTSLVRAEEGFAFWSWLGRAPTDAVAARRLDALLHDPNLPIQDLGLLREAILSGQLSVSIPEKETTYQRILCEMRIKVRDEVGRAKLLEVVENVAPQYLEAMNQIDDVAELQRQFEALFARAIKP
jgi:hypothetical protein